jgi:hypothetical protein
MHRICPSFTGARSGTTRLEAPTNSSNWAWPSAYLISGGSHYLKQAERPQRWPRSRPVGSSHCLNQAERLPMGMTTLNRQPPKAVTDEP